MNKIRASLFAVIIILNNISLRAEVLTTEIKRIEAIPQNEINSIFEDSRGYVWIATLDGLIRYDGHTSIRYDLNQSPKSISSNMLHHIAEDSRGNIWVGTYGRGICRIDRHTGDIDNFSFKELFNTASITSDVASIEIDRDDNIWIGNMSGVAKLQLDKATSAIAGVSFFPISQIDKKNRDYINKIHQDRDGNIWIGSNSHLRRVISSSERELQYESFDMRSNDICDYGDGGIISVAQGLTILTKVDDSPQYNVETSLSHIFITNVASRQEGSIWLGNRRGLNLAQITDGSKWQTTEKYTKSDMPFQLATSSISAIQITNDGQLWVGTRGGGVFTINKSYKLFSSYPEKSANSTMPPMIIKSILERSNGDIWFGTENDGIYIQQSEAAYGQKMKNLTINSKDNRAYALIEHKGERANRVWVGSAYPIYLTSIDPETLSVIPQRFNTFEIGFVFALCLSDSNTMWAGTYRNGLWRLSLDRDGQISNATQFTIENSSICSNIIRSINLDPDGTLWVATDMGVNRIVAEDLLSDEPTFHQNLRDGSEITLNDIYTLQIKRSYTGDLLFGSMDKGLIIYNPQKDTLTYIDANMGLANSAVKSFWEEGNRIWLATNGGVSMYDRDSNKIVNYTSDDGIEQQEFSAASAIKRRNGDIILGNKGGFVALRPQSIPTPKETPKLFFTELYVNHKRVEVSTESNAILNQKLECTSEISLKYDQRNFAIRFVGLNFISPEQDCYSYILDGFEQEWREIKGGELLAQYTNVPEGKYTFRVRVKNKYGVASNDELTLDIYVAPPLHRSLVAYIFYILLFILFSYVAFLIIRLIYRKQREVYMAQMEQRKVEDMTQYKLEFFVNISHDFRTPLTLISILLDSLSSKLNGSSPKELNVESCQKEIADIRQNTNQLLRLVTQLLDFRKIERGKQSVEFETVELNEFIEPYITQFKPLAHSREIDIHYNVITPHTIVNVDINLFEKVVINLLSNAFKYTPNGGHIEVIVDSNTDTQSAILTIKDSGCGIAKEELPHIFERFYCAGKNTSQSISSGVGLALCKSIVELLDGEISMQSQEGEGASCRVDLPLSGGVVARKSECSVEQIIIDPISSSEEEDTIVPQKHRKSNTQRDTILVVEDNYSLRHQLKLQLSRDFNIICAENGAIGLALCQSEYPSLIITDIMMPEMDGLEMCRQIKSDENISHTPILVLSADTSIHNQINSFTIGGADGYLDKPFNLEILRSKIDTILNNRKILKEHFQSSAVVAPEQVAHTKADLKCMTQIIKIIKRHMHNPDLSIEFIAQEYGVNRTYLNRKIKALTGETSTQFLRNIRLKYAAKLLLQKKQNVSEVAWSVGYTDTDTFRRRFKDKFGVSPTSYKGEPNSGSSSIIDAATAED